VICSGVHHSECGATICPGRLDLYRSAVGGMAVDPGCIGRRELEAKQLCRYGLADFANQVVIEGEVEVGGAIMILIVISALNRLQGGRLDRKWFIPEDGCCLHGCAPPVEFPITLVE